MAGVPLAMVREALAPRYRVKRELGRGGMATVFLATDTEQGGEVAIKILHPTLAVSLGPTRFRREIAMLRQLDHPNILPLLDASETGPLLYFAAPYFRGSTLRSLIKRTGPLPLDRVVAITRDVGSALDHAHERNILHRDIKPGNILIDRDRAVLFDFGVARAIERTGIDALTLSGVILGTPEYMSPEQTTGETALDARSDIYALGCVVYEMLAGKQPFTGPTPQAVFTRHVEEPPPSVKAVRAEVPAAMEGAVLRAMAKRPGDRPQCAMDLARMLEGA